MAIETQKIELINPAFGVLRVIAGTPVELTDIGGQLYMTMKQMCDVLGTTVKALKHHVETTASSVAPGSSFVGYRHPNLNIPELGTNLGGGMGFHPQDSHVTGNNNGEGIGPSHYFIVYETNVPYSRSAGTESQHGGGGGSQTQKFYSIELFLMVVERMANSPRKIAIMAEAREIVTAYYTNGVVINDYNQFVDMGIQGQVLPVKYIDLNKPAMYLETRPHVFNYTYERHEMASENTDMNNLIGLCTDILDANGQINQGLINRCRARMHNTAHVSIHGMTAKQLVYSRMDPNDQFFGQKTFAGKTQPRIGELDNACNFMSNGELYARTHQVRTAIGRIVMYIENHGPIPSYQLLRMFTMYCISEHIPYAGWDWTKYPETAIYTVVNMPDRHQMKKHIQEAIEFWTKNHHQKNTLDPVSQVQLLMAEETLCNACTNDEDLYETPLK